MNTKEKINRSKRKYFKAQALTKIIYTKFFSIFVLNTALIFSFKISNK